MSSRNLTLWLLGGAGVVALATQACSSAEQGQAEKTDVTHQTLQASLDSVDELPQDYVRVPGGIVMHKDCVHEVPNGAHVHRDNSVTLDGRTIAKYEACQHKIYRSSRGPKPGADVPGTTAPVPGTGNGWVETSWGDSTETQFTQMNSGRWSVPAAPTGADGETIFFFPSFQSSTTIIQPVLQYGPSSAGGGNFWAMTNWSVGSSGAFHGTLQTVNTNDQLVGFISTGFANATEQVWTVEYEDLSHSPVIEAANNFDTDTNPFDTAQAGVLEAYSVSQCSDFPSGSSGLTYFGAPTIYQGNTYNERSLFNPAWFTLNSTALSWAGPNCGLSVSVASNGTTRLAY